jgi:hypothetical protein
MSRHKKGVRGSMPRAEAPVKVQVRVGLSPSEVKFLDERRGELTRAEYLRECADLKELEDTDCPECGERLEWGCESRPGARCYANCSDNCGFRCVLERQENGDMKRIVGPRKELS